MPADAYPHLAELATEDALKPGYYHADEFTFGSPSSSTSRHRTRVRARELFSSVHRADHREISAVWSHSRQIVAAGGEAAR